MEEKIGKSKTEEVKDEEPKKPIRIVKVELISEYSPNREAPCPRNVAPMVHLNDYFLTAEISGRKELVFELKDGCFGKTGSSEKPSVCRAYKGQSPCEHYVTTFREKVSEGLAESLGIPSLDYKVKDLKIRDIVRKEEKRATILNKNNDAQRFPDYIASVSDELLNERKLIDCFNGNGSELDIEISDVKEEACDVRMIGKIGNGITRAFALTMLGTLGEYRKGMYGEYPFIAQIGEPGGTSYDLLKQSPYEKIRPNKKVERVDLRPSLAMTKLIYELERFTEIMKK